ncbi:MULTISPECIES: signal recognition particle-docking protein FtsY [Enterococcus]|jgi:fused signal recognition particle receptor|uniref:Signal recognition particle receptor FtsY n=2 Tax=Enterococcus faecalis TaxID=1351 RepID=A0A7H0FNH8_ENTFL|nr:signal recognition particle-docking protein FtsY [Enterococcus faecalis]EEI13271.1 signal recognition particle-docking protein FtsY [Enterococcus faecalis TX0104]EGO2575633.1 signal recognition particle-docking protein FtsY [Enterococcus faecalis]EGO2661090.1 signal recognition particle-docking protein FtsY [Enterococcus faecalis]EGO2822408.1 signal recognition particle-docking protein FtsY [Enterococcus faecalis]EGO5072916.1 signal recognition particle-docking protein FtsY [Enterococcus fa
MGFFDKIKKAFSAEKKEEEKQEIVEETVDETPSDESAPAESKETAAEEAQTTPETTAEEVAETADLTDNAEMEKLAGVEEALEEEPEEILTEETQEVVVEAPEEESSVVTPLTEPTDTQVSEEIEESKEEQVQEKYEKGLEKTRKTFGQRLNELFANFRSVDEDFFEELEETLIGADVGFDTSLKITEALRQEVKLRNVKKPAQVQNTIIEKMVDLYEEAGINENNAINLQPNGLTVILFVGVNGVGKTTSIGKLAHQYKLEGKKVLMAAADTFRAGAIDQLVVWGERAGVEVVRGNAGGDPAAVVFDAVERAKAEQADVLLVDTAGRLQNKVNLMKELEKIKRVIQREIPDAPHEVLLVVDATTGQNAMTQAKQFKETTDVTGLVLTKLDGTAKGGIVIAIRNELHLPVKLVGLGEGINDLEPFNANDFAMGLFKGLLKDV